jgi:hypothetical protein
MGLAASPSASKRLRHQELAGRRFGRLVVIRRIGKSRRAWEWLCECDCGGTRTAITSELTRGNARSCGCISREATSQRSRTHGRSNDPTYRSWRAMLTRCGWQKHEHFHLYGGAGIVVCDRWRDFNAFLADMGERPSLAHSIDRKDGKKGYGPGNCRWATRREQGNNRQTNVLLEHEGRTQTAAEWAREKGLRTDTLWRRINVLGWPVGRALDTPVAARIG